MSRVPILMIDDNGDDAEMLGMVCSKTGSGFEFSYTLDAAEGLARLRADAKRFRLVLLDIKMPGRDGKHVLTVIRREPSLRHLPVVVFSSSDAPADVLESYQLGANAYVRKPDDLDGWREFLGRLERFWLDTASLP